MELAFVNRRRQRGLALMVMVVVMIVGSSYILVRQLNSAAQRMNSIASSNNALAQAKDALVGYAATNNGRPGALPCPDRFPPGDANEGKGGSTTNGIGFCPNASDRVGRLPWKTLGLQDLRDASGERLWYALSDNFRDATGKVVNSDTPGTLNLNGNAAPSSPFTATSLASSIAAIVFAPGTALSGQNRDPTNASTLVSVANYLDGANGDVANDNAFSSALASDTFNDTLLAITHGDLFNVVDVFVASKLQTDLTASGLKPFLTGYASAPASGGVGYYPFAAPFTTPTVIDTTNYKGTSNTTYGLLPLTNYSNFLAWRIPAASEALVTVTSSTGTGTLSSNCSTGTSTSFVCNISYRRSSGTYLPTIRVTAPLQNVGMAYVDPAQILIPSGWITGTSRLTTKPTLSSKTMLPSGHMDLVLTGGRLSSTTSSTTTRTATITIAWSGSTSLYTIRPTAPSTPNLDWFFDNQWYRLTYYAIAAGWGPNQYTSNQTGACSAPNCLTVSDLGSPNDNKGALLVFTGRAVKKADGTDQVRPSSNLDDYLEGSNLTPANRVFTSSPRSLMFNDKVVVLTP